MTAEDHHNSATSAQIVKRLYRAAGAAGPFRLFAEAKVDPTALGDLAFASRKAPELMHHRLVTCPACDLLFANPIPATDAVEEAYAEASFDSADEARYASRTYVWLVDRIRRSLPDAEGVLDIGTGEGSFLEERRPRLFRPCGGRTVRGPGRGGQAGDARSDPRGGVRPDGVRRGDLLPRHLLSDARARVRASGAGPQRHAAAETGRRLRRRLPRPPRAPPTGSSA